MQMPLVWKVRRREEWTWMFFLDECIVFVLIKFKHLNMLNQLEKHKAKSTEHSGSFSISNIKITYICILLFLLSQ